jgi:hypothetical protein
VRVSPDVETVAVWRTSDGRMGTSTRLLPHEVEPAVVSRLRDQLAERDEIIVALQHVILDLRHEIENLRVEDVYATLAVG